MKLENNHNTENDNNNGFGYYLNLFPNIPL